jgi:hypothetical protein
MDTSPKKKTTTAQFLSKPRAPKFHPLPEFALRISPSCPQLGESGRVAMDTNQNSYGKKKKKIFKKNHYRSISLQTMSA